MKKQKSRLFALGGLSLAAILVMVVLKSKEGNGSLLTFKTSFVYSLAFRSNTTLVTSSSTSLQFWDVNTGKTLEPNGRSNSGRGSQLSFDGRLRLRDRQIYDVPSGALVSTLEGITGDWVVSPVFSHDGSLIASAVSLYSTRINPQRICVWNTRTGKLVWSVPFEDEEFKHPVAFSADGRWLVEASEQQFPVQANIILRDAHTGRQIRVIASDPDVNQYVVGNSVGWHLITFSPDAKLVAAVGGDPSVYSSNGHDRAIYVWEVATGKLLWKGLKSEASPEVIRFSPDSSVWLVDALSTGAGTALEMG